MSPLRMNRGTRLRSAESSRRIVTLLSAVAIFGSWGVVPMPLVAQRHQVVVEELRSIGVAAGNTNEEFGYLYGLAVDERRGLLFVFDAHNLRLSVFTRNGRFVAATGRSGGGMWLPWIPVLVSRYEAPSEGLLAESSAPYPDLVYHTPTRRRLL